MSHFLTIVVTKTQDEAELKAALQPFHEYECTNVKDQYVSFVDHHEEVLKDYSEKTRTHYRLPGSDKICSLSDPELYRDPTPEELANAGPLGFLGTGHSNGKYHTGMDKKDGRGYRAYIQREDVEEVELPFSYSYLTVEEFAKEWDGYEMHEGRFGRWTNPNKKWDWWQIGGRYSGRLFTVGRSSPCDQARKGDLDLTSMAANKAAGRLEGVTDVYTKIMLKLPVDDRSDERIAELWREYNTLIAKLRAEWEAVGTPGAFFEFIKDDERLKALRAFNVNDLGDWGAGVPDHEADPIAWAKSAPALTALAFLGTDGVWHEKGEMGWWGVIHDEKKDGDWETEFNAAVAAIPDDHWISVVDCHI